MFVYYYPVNEKKLEDRKQIIIADRKGGVKHKLHEGVKPSEIASGDYANIYMFDNQIRFYPHFFNTIYSIDSDRIVNVYHELLFGKYSFPNNDFFEKFEGVRQVQNTIEALYSGDKDWVSVFFAYETSNMLLTKYYIKINTYVGGYNKISGDTFNFENSKFEDDLGIGGKFPLPICVYDNLFVGKVDAEDIDKSRVEDVKLRELVDDLSKEDNPILFFYSIK